MQAATDGRTKIKFLPSFFLFSPSASDKDDEGITRFGRLLLDDMHPAFSLVICHAKKEKETKNFFGFFNSPAVICCYNGGNNNTIIILVDRKIPWQNNPFLQRYFSGTSLRPMGYYGFCLHSERELVVIKSRVYWSAKETCYCELLYLLVLLPLRYNVGS